MRPPAVSLHLAIFLAGLVTAVTPHIYSDEQQPPNADGTASSSSTTVPAFPVAGADNQSACHLDLSDELFGGVGEACVRGGLDQGRCCPVLAAWLFAAHARSAIEFRPPPTAEDGMDGADRPVMPDDNQKCVDSLQSALERRGIRLPRPNATCDTVLCFCGIRLHQIGSLRCPAAFNVSGVGVAAAGNPTPTAALQQLEHDCGNASYAGCTRCLHSLEKLKGNGSGERATRMFDRDCQLMGLTWLLARNRTAFIPTASAVLRALLYGAAHLSQEESRCRCSRDQDDMPLAVDSLQFQHVSQQQQQQQEDSSSSRSPPPPPPLSLSSSVLPIILLATLPFL
ncbi:hypothetical protein OPV22_033142 [Ensete ventricosum]|uniref:SPARK domain-containing protein n=1 Tax=Ensete ventricosum TaxID=4639 RepID=A0AAV8PP52_ENSVE|nr:hypothetical protein OPV22_033142 [Ensete ventricosum]